ncbi:MAG TPA: PQQ-dependent sugar dehydrogenase [Methylovorus sp.]|nr:PQQ-dependent sugar dehydrogenase [Methylovorus sp.]
MSKPNIRRPIVGFCMMLAGIMTVASGSSHADQAAEAPVPANVSGAVRLPAGFSLSVYARINPGEGYFSGPRMMAFGPDGHLYLTTGMGGQVLMLPDRDKDGKADETVVVADKLNAPNGLVFVNNQLLVANQDGVVRLEQKDGKWPAAKVQPIISGLATGGHTLKTIKQGPDGYLYLNVGSSCNVCVEQDPSRAAILRYTGDGKPAGALVTVGRHAQSAVWATGLRNSQGFAWHPETQAMFATNNGADMRSETRGGRVNDDIPPEHLNQIEAGKNYGWPHCWGQRVPDLNFEGPSGFCEAMQPPVITFDAHSTPLGITFLNQSTFPRDYQQDAIVALHGSWNRVNPSGYKLVRVKFKQNQPGEVTDFATGWLQGNSAWGRPVDTVVGPDGDLYVSDDRSGLVYRIRYQGK